MPTEHGNFEGLLIPPSREVPDFIPRPWQSQLLTPWTPEGKAVLADIQAEPVREFLQKLRAEEDMGSRTYNHYIQAVNGFTMWCVSTKRLSSNPLISLEKLNAEVDIRHQRRALTEDEVSKLLDSAKKSLQRIQGYKGGGTCQDLSLLVHDGLAKERNGEPDAG